METQLICSDELCRGNRPCEMCEAQLIGLMNHGLRGMLLPDSELRTRAGLFWSSFNRARKSFREAQDQEIQALIESGAFESPKELEEPEAPALLEESDPTDDELVLGPPEPEEEDDGGEAAAKAFVAAIGAPVAVEPEAVVEVLEAPKEEKPKKKAKKSEEEPTP